MKQKEALLQLIETTDKISEEQKQYLIENIDTLTNEEITSWGQMLAKHAKEVILPKQEEMITALKEIEALTKDMQ